MRQADRLAAIGRLSANIAHEIRNPLASVSGAIEVLARDIPSDPTRERLVEIVLSESARLNQLISDFLEYARPAPLAPTEVNASEILDDVLVLLEHRRLPDNLKVIREYGDLLAVRADPQQLRQAIWNLCLNAVQSMPDGGELRVGGRLLDVAGGPARSRSGSPTPAMASPRPTCPTSSSPSTRPSPRAAGSASPWSTGSCRSTGARSTSGARLRRGHDLHPRPARDRRPPSSDARAPRAGAC